MSITMPAVTAGYFHGGRNLTTGHRFFSNSILDEILAAARVDLASQDARITVVEGLVAGMDQKASVDLCTAGALNAYNAAGAGAGKTLTQNAPRSKTSTAWRLSSEIASWSTTTAPRRGPIAGSTP